METPSNIQNLFGQCNSQLIKDFIINFLPVPLSNQYKFFNVKTIDNCNIHVWGIDEDELIILFSKFLELQIFI